MAAHSLSTCLCLFLKYVPSRVLVSKSLSLCVLLVFNSWRQESGPSWTEDHTTTIPLDFPYRDPFFLSIHYLLASFFAKHTFGYSKRNCTKQEGHRHMRFVIGSAFPFFLFWNKAMIPDNCSPRNRTTFHVWEAILMFLVFLKSWFLQPCLESLSQLLFLAELELPEEIDESNFCVF